MEKTKKAEGVGVDSADKDAAKGLINRREEEKEQNGGDEIEKWKIEN